MSRSADQMRSRSACVHLGCVYVCMCGWAPALNTDAQPLDCCHALPSALRFCRELDPRAHHAELCFLIHFKRLTCKLYAAYHPPHGKWSHLG